MAAAARQAVPELLRLVYGESPLPKLSLDQVERVLELGVRYDMAGPPWRPGRELLADDARSASRIKCDVASIEACIPPSQDYIYTPLADPLLAFVDADKSKTEPATSESLNINLVLGSDFYGPAAIATADYGFQGYLGVPGLNDTGSDSRAAAYAYNVSWEKLPPTPAASSRAYYSAIGLSDFISIYGVAPERPADTIPIVFSQPVLPSSISPGAFRVTLNDGSVVTPLAASLNPNVEYNERQTVVVIGFFGNRLAPGTPGALFPAELEVVDVPGNPLTLIGPNGFTDATGLKAASGNPYQEGKGSRMLRAKLNAYSQLGEGAPKWLQTSTANSGSDLYGDLPGLYRLRIYNNYGFSPDGIASINPDDFGTFFYLTAIDSSGRDVQIAKMGKRYKIPGYGTVKVLGLAETGPKSRDYGPDYIEDHDNQYDVILQGSPEAVRRIHSVTLPSELTVEAAASGGKRRYRAVYNPGGPGNDPSSNPPGVPFVVPSTRQVMPVQDDITAASYVTYVEVNGTAARGPDGQPVGRLLGPAVISRRTGYTVNAYIDPSGNIFYASFPVQSACNF
ncbi:hypothetical protein Rsub_09060 [Raphidocelis subcapitata]|uniref:Uncharacterized protein n=1 Tax=Raphidocelis subcapitata TaxID=307507 RepID=A0A2V0PGS1_9CHLO|nr:hypothetical protein Rsub_09060 [Raphidocelis subcapitata]|eukprot:GBF96265.1 hypothetical protein Rsub_09060 [Raphidocelis subcapitata]